MTVLLLSIVVLVNAPVQFPRDSLILRRGGGHLESTPAFHVWYERFSSDRTIVINVWKRQDSGSRQLPCSERVETTSFVITADAPLPAAEQTTGGPYALIVVGDLANGAVAIERWKIELPQNPQDWIQRITVTKERLPSPMHVGTLRDCAIAPAGKVLLAQHDDTGDVLGIDLAMGSTCVLVPTTRFPYLCECNRLDWHRHAQRGGVFFLHHVDRGCKQTGDRTIILWDRDGDGVPESTEEVTDQESRSRGYNEEELWSPLAVFRGAPPAWVDAKSR